MKETGSGAALIVLKGPDKGREYPLKEELSIGRTQDNTLVRIERGMSRRHCIIRDEGGVYTLEDQGSANGTFLNDERVEELLVLQHGDRIQLAETTFLFDWPESHVDSGISTSPGRRPPKDAPPPPAKTAPFRRRSRRTALVALGFAAVAVCGAVGAHLLFTQGGNDRRSYRSVDRSAHPVAYSDSPEFRNTAFGLGEHDNSRPDKVLLTFPRRKGRPVVFYSVWGVDEVGEVVLRLNGSQIATAPPAVEYRHEIELPLPLTLLKAGVNELEFDNTHNPPDADPWEVAYIRIAYEPLLEPDEAKAQHHYRQGLRFYEDREVDPANRYRALQEFRRARRRLAHEPEPPPLYHEVSAMAQRVGDELQQVFELGRFSAERAYRFGDNDEARRYLRRTIRYFPETDDVRRDELSHILQTLE